MATGGVLGNGTKVAYSDSSPVAWTKIAQLMEVEIPGLIPDEIDTTVHSGKTFKRSMPGMRDVTDMTLTLLADLDQAVTASHDALRTYNGNQKTIWWRIEVPVKRDQTSFRAFEFQGWVKDWRPAAPIADKQQITAVIVFDGDDFSVYPAGASAIT